MASPIHHRSLERHESSWEESFVTLVELFDAAGLISNYPGPLPAFPCTKISKCEEMRIKRRFRAMYSFHASWHGIITTQFTRYMNRDLIILGSKSPKYDVDGRCREDPCHEDVRVSSCFHCKPPQGLRLAPPDSHAVAGAALPSATNLPAIVKGSAREKRNQTNRGGELGVSRLGAGDLREVKPPLFVRRAVEITVKVTRRGRVCTLISAFSQSKIVLIYAISRRGAFLALGLRFRVTQDRTGSWTLSGKANHRGLARE